MYLAIYIGLDFLEEKIVVMY